MSLRTLQLQREFQMSDLSIILGPPSNTWQSTDRRTSQSRQRRRDQPKTKHRSKRRRKHSSSSSSSSSRLSSLPSQRRSKRSKRSKHSHKRRRRRSTASSSSHDYGRYKRTRQSPQVVEDLTTPQPDRTIEQTPIIHSEKVVQQSSRNIGSDSESETWSFDRAINEVFRLLPNRRRKILLQNHCLESST